MSKKVFPGREDEKPCDLFYEDCHYVDFHQISQCAGYFKCLKGYTILTGCPIYSEILNEIQARERTQSKNKYNHIEAYWLMLYKCSECGFIEVLWNSRDGVTPFIIGCRNCRGEAKHMMGVLDKHMPDYKPWLGQRVFANMTRERAKEIANKRIKEAKGVPHPAYPPMTKERFDSIVEHIYDGGRAPCIDVWSK